MKRAKTVLSFMGLLSILAMMSGCFATSSVTSSGGSGIQLARADTYNGPKARIAVIDFEDKMSGSGYYRSEYGRGMADMLTTSLFNTNRYIVLERESIAAVEAERKRYGKQRKARIEDADILIKGSVTGFDPGSSGLFASGNKMLGFLSSVGGKKAHVAADIRVIDVNTGRIISSISVQGKAYTFDAASSFSSSVGGSLKGFSKTPMESAMRKMIKVAVNEIVKRTPNTYNRDQK
ncbi:MAG: CsgG/HfaB family protein [Gammaproteobacteria bacterium]